MNILFVTGPGRSGTSAFARYLNDHPEILVCVERYKWIRPEVTPSFFTRERILDHRKRETNTGVNRHVNLLNGKDPAKLTWIGDKAPGYVKDIRTVAENNPRARFIVMYRPIEEVVESYVARALDPDDRWLGGKDGFGLGVRDWNMAARNTREFVEAGMGRRILIVDYHDFFERNEKCIPLISRFLDLEFDEGIREKWKRTSSNFEGERRRKDSLSGEQKKMLRQRKDQAAEDWMLKRIEKQWSSLDEKSEEDEPTEAPLPAWSKVADELAGMEIESQNLRTRRLEQRIAELEKKTRSRGLTSAWGPAARELLRRLEQLRARGK